MRTRITSLAWRGVLLAPLTADRATALMRPLL